MYFLFYVMEQDGRIVPLPLWSALFEDELFRHVSSGLDVYLVIAGCRTVFCRDASSKSRILEFAYESSQVAKKLSELHIKKLDEFSAGLNEISKKLRLLEAEDTRILVLRNSGDAYSRVVEKEIEPLLEDAFRQQDAWSADYRRYIEERGNEIPPQTTED